MQNNKDGLLCRDAKGRRVAPRRSRTVEGSGRSFALCETVAHSSFDRSALSGLNLASAAGRAAKHAVSAVGLKISTVHLVFQEREGQSRT